jgi:hypothetical protein
MFLSDERVEHYRAKRDWARRTGDWSSRYRVGNLTGQPTLEWTVARDWQDNQQDRRPGKY